MQLKILSRRFQLMARRTIQVSSICLMMSYKRLLLYAILCTCVLCLLGISYQYDLIRGAILRRPMKDGSPQVRLVGQHVSGRLLDYRDIWMLMQKRHESEGGGHERGRSMDRGVDKLTLQGDISPVRVVLQNASSSGDDSQQKLKDTTLVIREAHPRPHCVKQIHIWVTEDRPRGIEPCPGLPCDINLVIDTNYQTLKTSDAVLLLHRAKWDWAELMSQKHEGQKLIFYSQESPINTQKGIVPPKEYYHEAYDYVMSYRYRESQLYGSYAYYDTSKPSVGLDDNRNWARGRKRQVAWLSSNCNTSYLHWNRTGFVKELSKLLDVGMYGKCGEQGVCPSRGVDFYRTCSGVLRQFKFYLALENCACRDYITEKFWNNAYLQDLIPIVFGPRRADYEAVAPPDSFIHIEDFETLQDLADYVNLLDKNDHLYNKFFEWKKVGSVVLTSESWLFQPGQMCQVVNRLLTDEKAARAGTFQRPTLPDWTEWWANSCRNISEFPIKLHR